MALLLRRTDESDLPIEVIGVRPDQLRGMTLDEIERFPIRQGNRAVPLAEVFQISGDPSDERIDFEGNLRNVHRIGAEMAAGRIVVDGCTGWHLAARMSGGRIEVSGDAGDWAGAEMNGGLIRIGGSIGDRAGAAYPGSKRGMTNGTILVGGSAGAEIGRSMRRGTIAIGGACGDHAGLGMIAGTILVFGSCGRYPGAEMRRGTIGLLGGGPVPLLPTFRRAGRFRPQFLALIERELRCTGFAGVDWPSGELDLYHGDLLSLGKGEIWAWEGGGLA